MTEQNIKALEERGFKRWTKGSMDRLYVNAAQLGLVCEYYNTGNIKSAYFRGNRTSNSEGKRMKGAKTFVDVATGIVYSDNDYLKEACEEILKGLEK